MQGYSVVALRYANAILQLAKERDEVEVVYKDMESLSLIYQQSTEFRAFLRNPVVNIHTKQATLEKLFSKSLSPLMVLFIKKLADSRREKYIGEITEAFRHQYRKMKNIVTAEVVSAIGLDDKIRNEVKQIILSNAQFSGSSAIEFNEKVDESIIGGIIITVEDKQVDASFSRKIKDFHRQFEENPYIKEF